MSQIIQAYTEWAQKGLYTFDKRKLMNYVDPFYDLLWCPIQPWLYSDLPREIQEDLKDNHIPFEIEGVKTLKMAKQLHWIVGIR